MGSPLSVVFADIFMTKLNPPFNRFVGNSNNRREKNKWRKLFNKLNSYRPKIKLTIKITPEKFLDRKNIYEKDIACSNFRLSKWQQIAKPLELKSIKKSTRRIQSTLNFTDLWKLHQTWRRNYNCEREIYEGRIPG